MSRWTLNLVGYLVVLSFLLGMLFTFAAVVITLMNYYYAPMMDKEMDLRFPLLLSIIGFIFILSTWLLDRTYSWAKKELTDVKDADEK